jgi:hypothetical protein
MTLEEFKQLLRKGGISHYEDPQGVLQVGDGRVLLFDVGVSIPPGVRLSGTLIRFSPIGWFDEWSGNIKGVRPTDLLNHLIQKGAFV